MKSGCFAQRHAGRAAVPAILALVLAVGAFTVPAEAGTGRGFVDPAPFDELAGDDDLIVYVSIGKTLLGLMSSAFQGEDRDLAEAVTRLESIHAVIVDVSKPEKRERGYELMRRTVRDLTRDRWERLAVVREEDVELTVMIRGTDDSVDGLVVLILDKSERQLIFANIAGLIDLKKLEAIGREFDIPGLDQVPKDR